MDFISAGCWALLRAIIVCGFGGGWLGHRGFSSSVGGALVLAGGWALGYHSVGFRQFPNIF